MKKLQLLVLTLLLAITPTFSHAQTADEIIDNYFENTGGKTAWENVSALKYSGTADAQGMEIPWIMYMTKSGKQALTINLQGQTMTQFAFDGETMWTTNFMTMSPEKSDAEASENIKKSSSKSFPSPFLNYKEKGYTVELIGDEVIEGTETFKIKLVEDPIMVDGVETPSITFYYFDKENFVPIAIETEVKQGPMAGQTIKDIMSDYQEVEGLYFPFSMTQGGQPLSVKSIEINPEIDAAVFEFPTVQDNSDKKE
ncbi:MAG: outer membrane lipoprotein-sorting protein [Flavobacteriaceae bacterium]